MKTSLWAKIFGWGQFVLQTTAQVFGQGTPKGWAAWLVSISSLAAAIGIHASSNTSGGN